LIDIEKLVDFSDEEINTMCLFRGIDIEKKSTHEKIKDLKIWLALSNLNSVPDSLLLYSRIAQMSYDLYAEDIEGHMLLKKNLEEEYYHDKLNLFNRTFAIDEVNEYYNSIIDEERMKEDENRGLKLKDDITYEDLERGEALLDEFKHRHNAIESSSFVDETGDDMPNHVLKMSQQTLEQLEDLISMTYYENGMLKELEDSHPELYERAKDKIFPLYYFMTDEKEKELESLTSDEKWKRLQQLSKELNVTKLAESVRTSTKTEDREL